MRQWAATLFCLAVCVFCPMAGRAQTQADMNAAASRGFQRTNARLNVVYRQVRATLDATGRKKLEKSEQAWVAYRDAEADWEADMNRGGSMEPMVYSSVQNDLTSARIRTLQRVWAEREGR